jgi:hypothetical protein
MIAPFVTFRCPMCGRTRTYPNPSDVMPNRECDHGNVIYLMDMLMPVYDAETGEIQT